MAEAQKPKPLPKLTAEQMRYDSPEAWIAWLEEDYPPPLKDIEAKSKRGAKRKRKTKRKRISNVVDGLNRLVAEGCSRDVLVELMQQLSVCDCEKLSHGDIKEAERALALADDWVERIVTSDWMMFVVRVDSDELRYLLSTFEEALRKARIQEPGGKRAFYVRDQLIASMVRHVKEKTKKLYDAEVSLLIQCSVPFREVKDHTGAASKGRSATKTPLKTLEYSLDAHRAWRKRNQDLINAETTAWEEAYGKRQTP